MLRFAANLSLMYNEHEFLDRFAAAASDGFKGVEFLFPYEHLAGEIRRRLDEHSLTQALFNGPPGNWAAGERGIASLPGREEEFRQSMQLSRGRHRGREWPLARPRSRTAWPWPCRDRASMRHPSRRSTCLQRTGIALGR